MATVTGGSGADSRGEATFGSTLRRGMLFEGIVSIIGWSKVGAGIDAVAGCFAMAFAFCRGMRTYWLRLVFAMGELFDGSLTGLMRSMPSNHSDETNAT